MVWQPLQRSDGWLTTWPLLGHQVDGYSDIERRDVDYRRRFLRRQKERLEAKQAARKAADASDTSDPASTEKRKAPPES